jgi:hypothetical protein
MRKGYWARSDLISDREAQPNVRRRAHRQAFGIYRPLSPESAGQIREVMNTAQAEVVDYFQPSGSKFTRMQVLDDFGVTIVQRGDVLRALRGSKMRNFQFRKLRHGIDQLNHQVDENPKVEIDGFTWVGNGLKLASKLAVSEYSEELSEEPGIISDLLNEAGSGELPIYEPDHVSLCKFKDSFNGRSLDANQKNDVLHIVRENFLAAEVGSLALDSVIIGNGHYRQPVAVPAYA